MKHVILLAYILIFSTGFAALAGLVFLSLRLSNAIIKRLILVQSLFIANLAWVAIYYYLVQVLDLIGSNNRIDTFFFIVASLLNIILYIGILLVLDTLKPNHQTKKLYNFTRIGCYACIFLLTLQLLQPYMKWLFIVQTTSYRVLLYLLIAVTMALFGTLLLHSPKEKEHRSYITLLKGLGFCCLAFVPLGALEFLLAVVLNVSYQPLSLEYLLYLGINCSIIIATFQALAKEPKSGSAFGELSEQALARFALTGREQEMARLIAQSLTNKEIAYKLGISEATVRTHIYNLFQKVGASNRIELLNILNQ